MNCPVCGKEANAYIVRCPKCVVDVHGNCWHKNAGAGHQK